MLLEKVHRVISQAIGELPIQEKGAIFKLAGVKRTEKIGDVPENNGFTESYTLAELKIKLNASFKEKFCIEAFSEIIEDNLTIFTTGGKQYMMPKAWIQEPGELGDAEFEIIYKSNTSPRLV